MGLHLELLSEEEPSEYDKRLTYFLHLSLIHIFLGDTLHTVALYAKGSSAVVCRNFSFI